MVGLVCVRISENGNRFNVCWRVIKFGVLNHFISEKWSEVMKDFMHKNCPILIETSQSIYDLNLYKFKYFDHSSTILCLKCFNSLGQNMFPVGKIIQHSQFVYH